MDSPTASRPPRLPLRTALIATVALLGLAACSSPESTSTESGSASAASEATATNDVATNEAAATNDVATSTEVSLTLEFPPAAVEAFETLVEGGSRIVVAREVETSTGTPLQRVWLSVNPRTTNQLTFDPGDITLFASENPLPPEPDTAIDEVAAADISQGGTATWNGEQFEVSPGSGDVITVTVVGDESRIRTIGLAGSATVNGTQTSAPYVVAYVATSIAASQTREFSDSGRILVWVSSDPSQPMPANATAIDTTSQPNARLRFNFDTQAFEPVS